MLDPKLNYFVTNPVASSKKQKVTVPIPSSQTSRSHLVLIPIQFWGYNMYHGSTSHGGSINHDALNSFSVDGSLLIVDSIYSGQQNARATLKWSLVLVSPPTINFIINESVKESASGICFNFNASTSIFEFTLIQIDSCLIDLTA